MEKYKKFLVFILVLAIVYSSKAQVNRQDSLALIALYNSADGANWYIKWDLSQPASTWDRVIVNNGRVTELTLFSNQLNGSIPGELGKLTNLTNLALGGNELSGSIPRELGNLTKLTGLYLSNNQLSGSIPRKLGNLTNLTELRLQHNQLSGSIPIELGKLINLIWLDLNSNQFDELPDLSSLTSLLTFQVENNRLDFDDILPNINVLTRYSPQFIREGIRYNTSIGEELTLSVQVDRINNVYQWYKDNNQLSGATNDTLKLPDIQIADHGLYHCQVTNAGVPNLILQSIPDTVIINGDAPLLRTDSLALIALYDSTEGANWKRTWDLSQPASTWHGVIVNNGRVTRLSLSSNQLSGSIPMELGNFNNLTWLVLIDDQLSGSIPMELGNLNNLTELYLDGNQLSGNIPEELGKLTNLIRLGLSNNQLSGSIPMELGDLTNLTSLNLHNNWLNGNIPRELGNLNNLTYLYLSVNQLSGSIPAELGKLINLTRLSLWMNELSESIPREFGKLANLTQLDLDRNQLSGSIPAELGKLTKLIQLSLWTNKLSGSIPVELGNLNNLTRLDLFRNQLSGNIPREFGKLNNLTYLALSFNQLSGSIPVELGNLNKLTQLYLSRNQLSGNIPVELGKLINLTRLELNDNQLSGNIPVELGKLVNLTKLYLNSNQLSGSIPVELGKLINLTRLELNDNQLSGNIPAELGKLTNLRDLLLDHNQLSGSIPMELEKLTKLTSLYLSANQLSGSIPMELEKLTKLIHLYLNNNQFDELPDLSSLTSLQSFLVENNRLDFGDILPNIGELIHYSPQAPIREGVRYNPSVGDELTLSVQVDGTNNVYQWFKNNTALSSATDDNLKLSNIQTADHGLYHCQVTNAGAPYLILRSLPDTVGERFTALDELDISNEVTIYPNPSRKNVIIEINNHLIDKGSIKVYSLNGKNEKNFPFEKNSVKQIFIFTIADLPSGIYILHGEIGDYYFTERIFKK